MTKLERAEWEDSYAYPSASCRSTAAGNRSLSDGKPFSVYFAWRTDHGQDCVRTERGGFGFHCPTEGEAHLCRQLRRGCNLARAAIDDRVLTGCDEKIQSYRKSRQS